MFRLYQEMGIDAAKKLYEVSTIFYQDIVKAESTLDLKHYFRDFDHLDDMCYYRDSMFSTAADKNIGELQEHIDDNGKLKAITFKDTFSTVQDVLADEICDFVRTEAYEKYKKVFCQEDLMLESEYEALYSDVYTSIRKKYAKVIQWRQQELKTAESLLDQHAISKYAYYKLVDEVKAEAKRYFAEISNDARWMLRKLSASEAGFIMYAVSNVRRKGRNWTIDEDSTNQMFLTIAPELYMAYVAEEKAELKVCGYELFGDLDSIAEGDVITFVGGVGVNVDVFIDGEYDGELTLQTVNDTLCAVKPIEIPRIEAYQPENWTIAVYQDGVIDVEKFMATRFVKYNKNFDALKDILGKAEQIKLVPFYQYEDGMGFMKPIYNAVVCTLVDAYDPSVKHEIPVASYLCNGKLLEENIIGLTANKVLGFAVDGKTAFITLPYGTFTEAAPNHTRVENDEAPELNKDIYSVAIKHEDKKAKENAFASKSGENNKKANTRTEEDEMLGSSVFDVENLLQYCQDEF